MRHNIGQRDSGKASRDGHKNHDEAHRLVHDDRRECRETENADQQRKAKLGAAQADKPAGHINGGLGHEPQANG